MHVRDAGKQRLYALNAEGLVPIHDWVRSFKKLWQVRFDRFGTYVEDIQSRTQANKDPEND